MYFEVSAVLFFWSFLFVSPDNVLFQYFLLIYWSHSFVDDLLFLLLLLMLNCAFIIIIIITKLLLFVLQLVPGLLRRSKEGGS
jgi:hypothetical protein